MSGELSPPVPNVRPSLYMSLTLTSVLSFRLKRQSANFRVAFLPYESPPSGLSLDILAVEDCCSIELKAIFTRLTHIKCMPGRHILHRNADFESLTLAFPPHLVASSVLAGLAPPFWERVHDLRVQQASLRTHPCSAGALLLLLLRK